jgi:hypothetical protein
MPGGSVYLLIVLSRKMKRKSWMPKKAGRFAKAETFTAEVLRKVAEKQIADRKRLNRHLNRLEFRMARSGSFAWTT